MAFGTKKTKLRKALGPFCVFGFSSSSLRVRVIGLQTQAKGVRVRFWVRGSRVMDGLDFVWILALGVSFMQH